MQLSPWKRQYAWIFRQLTTHVTGPLRSVVQSSQVSWLDSLFKLLTLLYMAPFLQFNILNPAVNDTYVSIINLWCWPPALSLLRLIFQERSNQLSLWLLMMIINHIIVHSGNPSKQGADTFHQSNYLTYFILLKHSIFENPQTEPWAKRSEALSDCHSLIHSFVRSFIHPSPRNAAERSA